VTRSLRRPTLSLMIPAGSSMKILDRNQAETTMPTITPDGSSSFASKGRKDDDRLIPIIMLNPTNRSS